MGVRKRGLRACVVDNLSCGLLWPCREQNYICAQENEMLVKAKPMKGRVQLETSQQRDCLLHLHRLLVLEGFKLLGPKGKEHLFVRWRHLRLLVILQLELR